MILRGLIFVSQAALAFSFTRNVQSLGKLQATRSNLITAASSNNAIDDTLKHLQQLIEADALKKSNAAIADATKKLIELQDYTRSFMAIAHESKLKAISDAQESTRKNMEEKINAILEEKKALEDAASKAKSEQSVSTTVQLPANWHPSYAARIGSSSVSSRWNSDEQVRTMSQVASAISPIPNAAGSSPRNPAYLTRGLLLDGDKKSTRWMDDELSRVSSPSLPTAGSAPSSASTGANAASVAPPSSNTDLAQQLTEHQEAMRAYMVKVSEAQAKHVAERTVLESKLIKLQQDSTTSTVATPSAGGREAVDYRALYTELIYKSHEGKIKAVEEAKKQTRQEVEASLSGRIADLEGRLAEAGGAGTGGQFTGAIVGSLPLPSGIPASDCGGGGMGEAGAPTSLDPNYLARSLHTAAIANKGGCSRWSDEEIKRTGQSLNEILSQKK